MKSVYGRRAQTGIRACSLLMHSLWANSEFILNLSRSGLKVMVIGQSSWLWLS